MANKTKEQVNKEAYDELMDLNLDLSNYCDDSMKRKDSPFTLTLANDIDLASIQRIRKLIADEMKRK